MKFLTNKRQPNLYSTKHKTREINKQIRSTESLQKILKCIEFLLDRKIKQKQKKVIKAISTIDFIYWYFSSRITHVTENILN